MAKLHDIDVDDYLASTVNVEPLAIEEEFVRLPADLAYWNERYARAHEAFLRAKIAKDQTAARLHIELREGLMDAARTAADAAAAGADPKKAKVSVKAPTVGDIDAAVTQHPDYEEVREAEVMAEVDRVRVLGVIDAVRAKKDMLIQLGARLRVELENDPQIREQQRVDKLKREGLGWLSDPTGKQWGNVPPGECWRQKGA